jgi:hypothetical protein
MFESWITLAGALGSCGARSSDRHRAFSVLARCDYLAGGLLRFLDGKPRGLSRQSRHLLLLCKNADWVHVRQHRHVKHNGHKKMLRLAVLAEFSLDHLLSAWWLGVGKFFVQCKKIVAHCIRIAKNEIAGRVHGYTTAWFFSLSHPQEFHP